MVRALVPIFLVSLIVAAPRGARAAVDDDVDTEFAKRQFSEGARFYKAKDYGKALGAFEAANLAKKQSGTKV